MQTNQNTLKEIFLPNYHCLEKDVKCMIQCKKLENVTICIDYIKISMHTFKMLLQDKHLNMLCLELTEMINIDIEDVAKLLSQPNLSQLTHLQLKSSNLQLFSCEILRSISSLENLTSLHLTQCLNKFKETYSGLFQFLQKCTKRL